MSEVTLTIVRPYQTVEEFLEKDAWTAGRTDLLLIDQDAVPMKTIVHFHVALASGETVFQGEGWAAGHVKPLGGRPGGLRVRFRKIDAASKAMLKRALDALERAQAEDPVDTMTPPARGNSAPPNTNSVSPPSEARLPSIAPDSRAMTAETAAEPSPNVEAAQPESEDLPDRSGVRYVVRAPVNAPANREELLERLRQRSLASKVPAAEPSQDDPERAAS